MSKRFYLITRDLHLYLGLFLSPFVLVFAISVFYLVHISLPKPGTAPPGRLVTDVPIPPTLEAANGREQIDALRPVLDRLGIHGEIHYVRRMAKERRLIVPVVLPGHEASVDLNLADRSALISERDSGLAEAVIQLHKMPGPHNVNIRGNSMYIQTWRRLADISTYGLLFLTLSGIYLWAVLKAERRIGYALLSLGAVSFLGLVYAIAH